MFLGKISKRSKILFIILKQYKIKHTFVIQYFTNTKTPMTPKPKLIKVIGSFKVSEETKEALKQIMDKKDRKEHEIVRYCLDATVKRFKKGKVLDEELY